MAGPAVSSTTPSALSHMRVVDLSDRIAGGYCTKFLGDFGAEVIKVERPVAGDPVRHYGPFKGDHLSSEYGGLHLFLNTNKKSMTLDVSKITGAEILKSLVKDADVLVETSNPGTLASYGLSFEELEKINPNLIIVSITDYGQTGSYKNYKGSDLLHWASSSLLAGGGLPGREPLRAGEEVAEHMAGLYGAGTILGAMFARGACGGQRIDISIREAFITALANPTLGLFYRNTNPARRGNKFPMPIVECKDGYIGFYVMLQHQWEHLSVLTEKVWMQDDERFATPLARNMNPDAAMAELGPWFKERTVDEVVQLGQELRVPTAPVASADRVARNPQFRARGYFTDIGKDKTGKVQAPGRPFNLEKTPWKLRAKAPTLGEHNKEIYCNRLGFSKEEMVILSEQGVL